MIELFTPFADLAMLLMRLSVGVIFIVHGWPKITKSKEMTKAMGQPQAAPFFTVQGIVEAGGGLLMIAGIYTGVVAILFSIIMLGAIGLKNSMMKTGFTSDKTTGWEFDLILLAANLVILTYGPGAFSAIF